MRSAAILPAGSLPEQFVDTVASSAVEKLAFEFF